MSASHARRRHRIWVTFNGNLQPDMTAGLRALNFPSTMVASCRSGVKMKRLRNQRQIQRNAARRAKRLQNEPHTADLTGEFTFLPIRRIYQTRRVSLNVLPVSLL